MPMNIVMQEPLKGFLGHSVSNESACECRRLRVRSLGWEDPLASLISPYYRSLPSGWVGPLGPHLLLLCEVFSGYLVISLIKSAFDSVTVFFSFSRLNESSVLQKAERKSTIAKGG